MKGIMPAIASPCDDNGVFLEDEFAALAENLYEQGSNGLYVCGATGDGYNMLPGERKRAVEIAVQTGRKYGGKTIAHVGTSNTRDSIGLAVHAAGAGADAVSAMPPASRNLAQLVSFYGDIASASGLPLLVYHIPILTGRVFSVGEMLQLLNIPGVIGFKFSDWNLYFMRQVLKQRPEIIIFNGNDEFLCPGLMYGAHGGIGLNYNVFPKLFIGIYKAVGQGDITRAMELQNLLCDYMDVVWNYGLQACFSVIMREIGFAPQVWRKPRQELDDRTTRRFISQWWPRLEAIRAAV